MIIDFESSSFIADMDVSGEIAGLLAADELASVKVMRLHVSKVDERQGEMIAAEQCECTAV